MSTRTLIGALFLIAAVLAPWMVADWLPEGWEDQSETVSKRKAAIGTESVPNVSVPPLVRSHTEQRRSRLPQGIQKPLKTGAKISTLYSRKPKVARNQRTQKAVFEHQDRLQKELQSMNLELGARAYCRLFKEEKEFELWLKPKHRDEYSLFRVYRICAFEGGVGPKRKAGDDKVPEGFYFVPATRMLPDHKFHMGFDLGYPNQFDSHWLRDGKRSYVNGSCKAHNSFALSDKSIEEVYLIMASALDAGQEFVRVHSFPFRMDDRDMDKWVQAYPRNDSFWANLKEGYDFFEILRRPPNATLSQEGRYLFSLPENG